MKPTLGAALLALLLAACGPGPDQVVVLHIEGTHCAACEKAIRQMLLGVDGVKEATVSHPEKRAEVLCAGDVKPEDLVAAVLGPDYIATLREVKDAPAK